MDIGNKIKQLRERHELSQVEFAEIFHVSRQTVSNWENNKNYPDMDTLKKISDKFDVSFDELLKDDMELIREIDKDKKKAGKVKWLALAAVILAAVIVVCIILPKTVKSVCYDPTETVASYYEDGYDIETDRMSMDMTVWSELFLPCRKFGTVQAADLNWGKYNVIIGQDMWPSGTEQKQVAGQIERNKLVLYDPVVLQKPPGNAFEWTINTRDTSLSIRENLSDGEQAMGMHGGRKAATELLEMLVPEQKYIGYASFNNVIDYEDVGKMLNEYDVMLSWVGIVTSNENHQEVIGMYNYFSGSMYPFDSEKYPFLLGYKGLGDDDTNVGIEYKKYAKQHFISMLKYMNEQKEFLEMIEPLEYWEENIEEGYYLDKIEYIEKNGLNVYGVAVVADKETLLELNMHENVYSIATEPY